MLSFIVPVYKPDTILFEKVVKALTAQSLKAWEVVFVLDGECPEARPVINKGMKKVPNSYKIVEIEHGGAQKARNAGFPHTKGNYVIFMDSDVVIEPHAALNWVEILDKNPEYGFVYSGYKFLNEMGAINSEPFDPYTLRVRNYISTCFPLRRELFPGWDESLESAQDWDFWLSVVEKGGVGKFQDGYAFSTAFPTPSSISGKGCTPEVWLERQDKVKKKHGIPLREVCITSLHNRLDGIALAKALDADYQDNPNDKPNHYKTIIQLGFSVNPGEFERCASVWGTQHKKVIFWTAEDVEIIHDTVSLRALTEYSARLNMATKQFVEDKHAKEIMNRAGFNVEILPLPVISKEDVCPLPEEPRFLVDVAPNYGHVFNAIQHSIPDIKLEKASGAQKIEDYTGYVCFHQDRLLRPSIKRMIAAGRHVVSNVQAAFAGYMDDRVSDAKFIKDFVNKIRSVSKNPQSKEGVKYYIDPKRVEKIAEVCK
jgi:glycosyltransferase involved in cell wall biosynthesis